MHPVCTVCAPWRMVGSHHRCIAMETAPPREHAVPHCAALGRQASFKGTALMRLKECKDDQYLSYPYFRRSHDPGEYSLVIA
ncbi:unnamed protein product [Lasius platythorax]|uniref:Uncharacterized protein n=1 Tax=Lasius platythorax TaxID=488582 RepID=A0AAV2P4X6_9HYME